MNKSYSKIRHIQEANVRLEKRILSEQAGTQKTVPQQVTDLYNKLKSEYPLYTETDALRVDGNRVYYLGNINSTTVTDRQGNVNQKKSQIGTLTKASDPNARFFEWTGTGWKRGEQQNKYYDVAAIDQNAALTDFAKLSPKQQPNPVDNVASTN
jgi:hypothetical protein